MKIFNQLMYCILDKNGIPDPKTLQHSRRTCIQKFMEGSTMTWKQITSYGWICKKVEVKIQY